jgi:predicted HTH domain antitoxin
MQITLNVPEQYLVDRSPAELGQRIKLLAALLMFQSGEMSAGGAAEFADVDRFTFAAECQRHGIPVIDYPPEELERELDGLRRHVS